MIWILSVETQRVHRKIFIHYVFTSQNRSGGEKSEFSRVRISANEQQLDHMLQADFLPTHVSHVEVMTTG